MNKLYYDFIVTTDGRSSVKISEIINHYCNDEAKSITFKLKNDSISHWKFNDNYEEYLKHVKIVQECLTKYILSQ